MTNEVNTCCYSNKILTAGGSKVVYLIHELPQVSTNKIWVDPNKHNINKASHHRELCIDSTLLFMLSLIITNFFLSARNYGQDKSWYTYPMKEALIQQATRFSPLTVTP